MAQSEHTLQTSEIALQATECLSTTAIRSALAERAYRQAVRELEAARYGNIDLLELFYYAKKITVQPQPGCSLDVYESLHTFGSPYFIASPNKNAKKIRTIGENEEFVGEGAIWDEGGIVLNAHKDKSSPECESVRLEVDETDRPKFKVNNIEFELSSDVEEASGVIIHMMTETGRDHRWQPNKLRLAVEASMLDALGYDRLDTSVKMALSFLIFTGQVEQYEDGRVVLPQLSAQ